MNKKKWSLLWGLLLVFALLLAGCEEEPEIVGIDVNDVGLQFSDVDYEELIKAAENNSSDSNEPNDPLVLSWSPVHCYGISFEFSDVNSVKPYFASITDYNCQNSTDIHIKIGSIEKNLTADEFFRLLGFNLQDE